LAVAAPAAPSVGNSKHPSADSTLTIALPEGPPPCIPSSLPLQEGPLPSLCPADGSSVLSTLIVSDNNLSGPLRVSLCSRLTLLDVQVGAVH